MGVYDFNKNRRIGHSEDIDVEDYCKREKERYLYFLSLDFPPQPYLVNTPDDLEGEGDGVELRERWERGYNGSL